MAFCNSNPTWYGKGRCSTWYAIGSGFREGKDLLLAEQEDNAAMAVGKANCLLTWNSKSAFNTLLTQ